MKGRRFLDFASSRPGIYLGLVLIVASFLATVGHFMQQYDDFRRERSTFLGLKMREGFVSLSDLQRINLIVLGALREGGMSATSAADLARAADFLYVRIESFRRNITAQNDAAEGRRALALLEKVIATLDAERASNYSDLDALSAKLITLTDETRRLLFVFLDDQRRSQEVLLNAQSDRLRWQTWLLSAILFFLTVVAGASLLLLLREGRLGQHVEEAESRAQFLAFFDSLTGLPNRNQFQDRAAEHLASGAPVTMIFVDLDNFKGVNDSLGHAAGDEVLRMAAGHLARLSAAFGGMAARIAGDEFAILLSETDGARLSLLAEAILEAVEQPILFEGETIEAGMSLGIAPSDRFKPPLEVDFETLSRVADFCLYASKSAGRGRYTIFDDALNEAFHARSALLHELSSAIGAGEIETWFQPKVVLATEAVFGFEALCRWRRDGRLMRPGDFIPLAESSGAIVELDRHVMRMACKTLAAWNAGTDREYSVSVNLSALHFGSFNIVDHVARTLADIGLPPHLLTLEITESVQLVKWDTVGSVFSEIRRLGCRISIDDFGSGYSSLAYLRAIQADELKIDRSLVGEIETSEEARHVLGSVIDLAHSLGMQVIVEGVETETQADILMQIGGRNGQGFLFGKPLPAAQALARHAASLGRRAAS